MEFLKFEVPFLLKVVIKNLLVFGWSDVFEMQDFNDIYLCKYLFLFYIYYHNICGRG